MHAPLNKFVGKIAKKYCSGRAIEFGSFNENGSVRESMHVDIGIDMRKGKDVDIVLNACDAIEHFGEETFDTVVSTDALEHSEQWKCFISNMLGVLKTDGIMILTAAHPRKGRHNYPNDYWRFTESMFDRIFSSQEVLARFDKRPSNGIVIRKLSNELDMDFEPLKVK